MSQQSPSLNMDHGFMKSIIRNQLDRDNYHKEVAAEKERDRRERRKQKQKRPEQARYVPPKRAAQQPATILFKLEYEDEWGKIHERPIRRNEDPHEVALTFGREQDLSDDMIRALETRIRNEVDQRLKQSHS